MEELGVLIKGFCCGDEMAVGGEFVVLDLVKMLLFWIGEVIGLLLSPTVSLKSFFEVCWMAIFGATLVDPKVLEKALLFSDQCKITLNPELLFGIVWLKLGIWGGVTGRLYDSCELTDCVISPGSVFPCAGKVVLLDCIALCSSLPTCGTLSGYFITSLEKIFFTYAGVVLLILFEPCCPVLAIQALRYECQDFAGLSWVSSLTCQYRNYRQIFGSILSIQYSIHIIIVITNHSQTQTHQSHYSNKIIPFSYAYLSKFIAVIWRQWMKTNEILLNLSFAICIIITFILKMPQRKIWTAQEDKVLKFLIEERGLRKWCQISRAMEEEFGISGRNGKQCRQRYHNHLDKDIVNAQWLVQQQDLLFNMQDQLGNKWALISSKLPGRSDNCVKNHFYSKLRKSLRSINKKIHKMMRKEYREIKTAILYKIIQTIENRNRRPPEVGELEQYELCRKIKNQLWYFDATTEEEEVARGIIEDFAMFDKDIKKNPKKNNQKTSLKSSAKLSKADSEAKYSSGVISSTKSMYDDESQSLSNNSELFSSSSFGHSMSGSQQLLRPNQIFRSQKIQSQSEDDSDQGDGQLLYKSAQSLRKAANRVKQQIQITQMKMEGSVGSRSSLGSNRDENCTYMFGEESLEMRVISPRQLTIEQKMEIAENSGQLLFEGEMEIDNQDLVKNFAQMGISSIPCLGKYTI